MILPLPLPMGADGTPEHSGCSDFCIISTQHAVGDTSCTQTEVWESQNFNSHTVSGQNTLIYEAYDGIYHNGAVHHSSIIAC